MTLPLRLCVVVLISLSLAACAGRDFTRAAPDSLQLGKTTYAEVVARFGTPYREGTMLKNNQMVKHITYAYSTTGGTPLHDGVMAARSQAFYFADLVLVGHEFTSSFKEDHTEFPEAKVTEIRKGETKESGVVELFSRGYVRDTQPSPPPAGWYRGTSDATPLVRRCTPPYGRGAGGAPAPGPARRARELMMICV